MQKQCSIIIIKYQHQTINADLDFFQTYADRPKWICLVKCIYDFMNIINVDAGNELCGGVLWPTLLWGSWLPFVCATCWAGPL